MNWTRSQQRKAWSAKSDYNIPYDEENAGLQGNRYRETPEDTAIAVEAEQLLLQALQELKNSYREVFILRMVEGLSVSETAKILKIPEGTVKTYLHRGRQKLRHWLLKHDWNLKE
jgi:RNA polymerase sigma-70 factor (ECF subfamily)